MGNGEAINHICENINKYKFVKRVGFRGQWFNDEALQKIFQMLEKNESIKTLDFSFLLFFYFLLILFKFYAAGLSII